MTWAVVATKDVRDAVRSYWLWGLSAVFVVFFTVPAYLFADQIGQAVQQQGGQVTSDAFLRILAEINAFFVPIIAIILAYAAIAGERDSGTLKLLLSLPHSRRDVVLGKLVGRSVVAVIPVLIGFAVAGVVFLVTPVTFAGANYLGFALLTALLAVVFVGISVGVSAAAYSGRRAMIGTVAVFVVFTLFWTRFAQGLTSILSDQVGLEGATLVKASLLVSVLNPTQSFKSLTTSLVSGDPVVARASLAGGSGLQGQLNQQAYAQMLEGSLPAYLSDPALVLILLAWIVGMPLIGYAAFREADL